MMISCSRNLNEGNKKNLSIKEETSLHSMKDKDTFDFYGEDFLTHIDSEELCEFRFDFFLPQLNQILNKKGLKLEVKTANDYDQSLEVEINGNKLKLYTHKELEDGTFWEKGPRNFFKEINENVLGEQIEERFYLLYDGNDLCSIFLTEDQFKKMSKNNEKEIPYLP